MAIKNYKFVSPGVQVQEIDNSAPPQDGAPPPAPVVIGRAQAGPSMRPVTVNSFAEFIETFGNPVPGGDGSDVWRTGNLTSPMYGTFAAQAWLKNSSPLTYVRVLGNQDPQATTAGEAGWKVDAANDSNGKGAYGLFLFNSASVSTDLTLTGHLGAIFYSYGASTKVQLSGNVVCFTGSVSQREFKGSNTLCTDTGAAKSFTAVVTNANAAGNLHETASFNFNRSSSKYIRKVFNTNPQLVNSTTTDSSARKNYWLGETFDRNITANVTAASTYACLIPLQTQNGTYDGGNYISPAVAARTPDIIACDPIQRVSGSAINWNPRDEQSLFSFRALGDPGDWTNRNIKISIQDIKVSPKESDPYGTFTILVRRLDDSDQVVQVLEAFTNCNLNPNSLNYVGRKVGDTYRTWSTSKKLYEEFGDYPNNSRYVRIVMNSDVDAGTINAELLPFGFKGVLKYADTTVYASANQEADSTKAVSWLTGSTATRPIDGYFGTGQRGDVIIVAGLASGSAGGLTASMKFPAPELRVSASDGNLSNQKDAYFGFQTGREAGSARYDQSTVDVLRPRGGLVGTFASGSGLYTDYSVTFTLDDVRKMDGTAVWESGSHALGRSWTSITSISGVLDGGYDRFTVPMVGGYDGFDIMEMDPLRNTGMSSPSERTNSPFYSLKRAVDAVTDPEVIEMNLATMPGITQNGLTSHLIQVCEDRADALAIVDLDGGFVPRAESTSVDRGATSGVTTTINNLRARGINSSYACAYYPWVQTRDTITGQYLWMPPSVAALGTFSSSQRKTQVWFAPAGFNRGGLSEGAAGIPVIGVSQRLTKAERDKLYDANINPIAKFPAEGIVIFGQKTLQTTASALDRINVRRLLLFLKKRISRVATQVLFDPNIEVTWERFKALADPILADAQANFGLSEYSLILDASTTTPDLVDRNIMYAKVFLKPTRAIEFIAIDFNVTRTGAAFVD